MLDFVAPLSIVRIIKMTEQTQQPNPVIEILQDIVEIESLNAETMGKVGDILKTYGEIVNVLIQRVQELERRKTAHSHWWQ